MEEDIEMPLWQVLQIMTFELFEPKFSENEVFWVLKILQGWLTGENFCDCGELEISTSRTKPSLATLTPLTNLLPALMF